MAYKVTRIFKGGTSLPGAKRGQRRGFQTRGKRGETYAGGFAFTNRGKFRQVKKGRRKAHRLF